MKKMLTIVTSLVILVSAAGCGGGTTAGTSGGDAAKKPEATTATAGKDVKLRVAWWGGQARHDYTLKIIELYQKNNPNVKIEAEYAAFDDYWKKLSPQAAANDMPDVIQMDDAYISQYGDRGQLEDLKTYMDKGVLDKSNIPDNFLKIGQYNGKQYQITLGVNALAIIHDPAMMKNAGATPPTNEWTWNDIDTIGAKLKAGGKLFTSDIGSGNFLNYYLRTMGQQLYNKEGTALGYSDDKLFVDYFKRQQKWYDAGYFLPLDKLASKKGTPEDDEMSLGNSSAIWSWSNLYVAYSAAAKRPLEMVAPPGPDGKKGLFLKSSQGLSITKNSKNKDEAAKFVNFVINDPEVHKIMRGERGVPISTKMQETIKPLLKPEEQKVLDYVSWAGKNSNADAPVFPVGSVEVLKNLKDLGEQIMYKKITPEDAAVKFRKDSDAILAKNKK